MIHFFFFLSSGMKIFWICLGLGRLCFFFLGFPEIQTEALKARIGNLKSPISGTLESILKLAIEFFSSFFWLFFCFFWVFRGISKTQKIFHLQRSKTIFFFVLQRLYYEGRRGFSIFLRINSLQSNLHKNN